MIATFQWLLGRTQIGKQTGLINIGIMVGLDNESIRACSFTIVLFFVTGPRNGILSGIQTNVWSCNFAEQTSAGLIQ